ncbi:MAG: HNH endonuclease [Spirochaetales bacterium]|nr:HNH endonuclease [Spirochaetales bacterium]
MGYSNRQLDDIYDKTDGRCHLCGKKLAISNYGIIGTRGAWEVEHSVPRARGGSSHLNNLYPACIPCNREKGTRSSRTHRKYSAIRRAPMSAKRKTRERRKVTAWSTVLLSLGGAAIGGGRGFLVGGLVGYGLGRLHDPEATLYWEES